MHNFACAPTSFTHRCMPVEHGKAGHSSTLFRRDYHVRVENTEQHETHAQTLVLPSRISTPPCLLRQGHAIKSRKVPQAFCIGSKHATKVGIHGIQTYADRKKCFPQKESRAVRRPTVMNICFCSGDSRSSPGPPNRKVSLHRGDGPHVRAGASEVYEKRSGGRGYT